MQTRSVAIMLVACLLAACSSHEGTYSPSCIAYAGDTIELIGGQFTWDKFTDALVVDEYGNLVDQFPGYPMHGTYRIDGDSLSMESASGEALQSMHLQQSDSHYYLLTGEQFEIWESTGRHAQCALMLGGHRND